MIKKLTLIIFCLLLTSCHKTIVKSGYDTSFKYDQNEIVEISFWAKNDTNKYQVEVYKNAIETFNTKYPNIKVNLKLYTDYNKIYNDVITNISTNTTPNICITYPDHIATYLENPTTILKLDELIIDETYGLTIEEMPNEKLLNEGKINGSIYCLPFMRSTEILYYNKTFVKKLGYQIKDTYTWDEIFEISKKAMEKDENGKYLINGQNVLIPFIYKSTDNMMIQMLQQLNLPYSTSDGQNLMFNDDTKKLLLDIKNYSEQNLFSTFKISSYPANFLNAGQAVFAIDSSAGATWMGSKAPLIDISKDRLYEFELGISKVAQFDVDNIKMISQGPSIAIFNKDNQNEVIASWLFSKHLLSKDIQLAYSKTEGYIPVCDYTLNSNEYKEYISNKEGNDYFAKIEASKILMENIDNTFVTPVYNGSISLRNAAGQLIEEVVKGVKRNKQVDDEYIDKIYNDLNVLYKLEDDMSQIDFNSLPFESKVLLYTISIVWVCIILVGVKRKIGKR